MALNFSNNSSIFLADTSVLINLSASGYWHPILECFPSPVVVTEEVYEELQNGQNLGYSNGSLVKDIRVKELVSVATMDDVAYGIFETLVVGNTHDTLDDGEASIISMAISLKGTALIDERKAKRICSERYPILNVGTTVDIFRSEEVISSLSKEELEKAIYNALRVGRMRVPSADQEWVIKTVGKELIHDCPSLPTHIRT